MCFIPFVSSTIHIHIHLNKNIKPQLRWMGMAERSDDCWILRHDNSFADLNDKRSRAVCIHYSCYSSAHPPNFCYCSNHSSTSLRVFCLSCVVQRFYFKSQQYLIIPPLYCCSFIDSGRSLLQSAFPFLRGHTEAPNQTDGPHITHHTTPQSPTKIQRAHASCSVHCPTMKV